MFTSAPITDPIDLPPVLRGKYSSAWAVDLDAFRKGPGGAGPNDASVAGWVVQAPWAHPVWHSYLVSIVHLRPLPRQTVDLIIKLEGATHEVFCYALCPEHPRLPLIKGEGPPYPLTPANYVGQFVAASDAAAMEQVEKAVQQICDGTLSPDTDFRRLWFALFGDHFYR